MNIRKWLDPAHMPDWWYGLSAILVGAILGYLVAKGIHL